MTRREPPPRAHRYGIRLGWAVALTASLDCQTLLAAQHLQQVSPRQLPRRAPARAPVLVVDSVTVVDVVTGELREHQRVVVRGRHIAAVGPVDSVPLPARARVVKVPRKHYLIPGLWDMHMHTMWMPDLAYRQLIANGVTGARDPGNPYVPLATQQRWRREIAAGRRVGPRLVLSGGFAEPPDSAAARRIVDSLQAAGADFVKNYLTYGGTEAYFALAAEARRIGLPLEGHVPYGVSLEQASDSGQRIIDHPFLMYPVDVCYNMPPDVRPVGGDWDRAADATALEACRALAQHLQRNGTWLVPTLSVPTLRVPQAYAPVELRFQFAHSGSELDGFPGDMLALAQQAGLPLLAGTDNYPHGFKLHDELATFVREGLTPLSALQTATLNPALAYDATDSLGTVAVGKLADLVLLEDNPLEDIHNTTHIVGVVADGRYYDPAALHQLLVEARELADRCPTRRPFVPAPQPGWLSDTAGKFCTR